MYDVCTCTSLPFPPGFTCDGALQSKSARGVRPPCGPPPADRGGRAAEEEEEVSAVSHHAPGRSMAEERPRVGRVGGGGGHSRQQAAGSRQQPQPPSPTLRNGGQTHTVERGGGERGAGEGHSSHCRKPGTWRTETPSAREEWEVVYRTGADTAARRQGAYTEQEMSGSLNHHKAESHRGRH